MVLLETRCGECLHNFKLVDASAYIVYLDYLLRAGSFFKRWNLLLLLALAVAKGQFVCSNDSSRD